MVKIQRKKAFTMLLRLVSLFTIQALSTRCQQYYYKLVTDHAVTYTFTWIELLVVDLISISTHKVGHQLFYWATSVPSLLVRIKHKNIGAYSHRYFFSRVLTYLLVYLHRYFLPGYLLIWVHICLGITRYLPSFSWKLVLFLNLNYCEYKTLSCCFSQFVH